MEHTTNDFGRNPRRRYRTHKPRIAALDLGTNNCRLLVAEPTEHGFEVVDSFSRIVRLGEGLGRTNRLSEGAMSRTIRALRICKQIIERSNVIKLRCVATEACRRADNGPAFLTRVKRATGLEIDILEQTQEAELAMLGCLPLIDHAADHVLMVDIGGGSTELLHVDRGIDSAAPNRTVSLPIGVVTLTEAFDAADGRHTYGDMVDFVRDLVRDRGGDQLLHEHDDEPDPNLDMAANVQMLGTSGTVTTLAALHLGLRHYDRRKVDGVSLSFASIDAVSRYVRNLHPAALASHPCIGRGRADLVVAGCAILDVVHEIWPVPGLRVADRGVREGILNSLLGLDLAQAMSSRHLN